jgi:hypothetical protein
LVISFLVRIYRINTLSLFGDEIDVGYQAFSLLNTGHDYKGNFLPTYIQSLSESRAPLLIYSSIPGIKIFGLTALGVRITPIIFSILSIFLFYQLILLLSKNNKLALLSAFALSFSPWHFHYSRTSFEVTLLLSLILLGTYWIFKYFYTAKNKFLYLSIFSFCLTFYTYNTANIFTPLLIVCSFLIFLVITAPLLYQIFFGAAANRFNLISIFKNQTLIDNVINQRTSFSASNSQIEAIFHNKPLTWTQEFSKNYISSFSPSFLFVSGDQLNLRQSIPGFGLLFITFLPLLIIGIFNLNLKEKINQLMLFWLLISPIAAALTINGGNHATRLFLMILPLSYFIGLGITKILNLKKLFKNIIIFVLSLTLIIEICLYSHEYFVHYSKDSFEVWNWGYQEIFQNIPASSNRIFISNTNYNSLLPFLFYSQYSPKKENALSDTEKPNIINDLSGFQLSSNIYFVNNWQSQNDIFKKITQFAQKGDTFVLFQLKEIPGDFNLSKTPILGFSTIKTIFNPNHTILAQIIQKQ